MKSFIVKLGFPRTALLSLFVAWVTLTLNAHEILIQHALRSWGLALLLGTLLTLVFLTACITFEFPRRFFLRRNEGYWVFAIMPIAVMVICSGVMQLFWIIAPFLHAS
jgi:hypothetical protein